jgi:hypothetical protein
MSSEGWTYINAIVSREFNPDGVFWFPEAYCRAKEKYIIIREIYTTAYNPHIPQSEPVDNLMLYADFVDENEAHNYVALSNSPNMRKKKYQIKSRAQCFRIWFKTIDGHDFWPETYLFDILLKFR